MIRFPKTSFAQNYNGVKISAKTGCLEFFSLQVGTSIAEKTKPAISFELLGYHHVFPVAISFVVEYLPNADIGSNRAT